MNKFLLLALLCPLSLLSKAQTTYNTINNIYYYADSSKPADDYKKTQCRLKMYYPTNVKNYPTIVWFHGGGITGGKSEIPKELMNKGYAVISAEYRLSPKVQAPVYIEDASAAVAWAFKKIGEFGGNKRLIFVSGHSAGGYLGMMLTLDKKYLDALQVNADSIAALIPFSGQCVTHFTVRKEQGIDEKQPTIDQYAPLYHVRPDAPPTVLITGDRELELLGRYEENAYMWRMMRIAGHKSTTLYELDGFDHGGMPLPAYPLLIKEVAKITKQIMGEK